jgi:hypothetical protein
MNRRLYFMLPDVDCAQRMMNELLLARVEARHIHFLAKPGIPLGDLPIATVSQRTDTLHGSEIGLALGAALGLLGGVLAVQFPPWYFPVPTVTIAITTVVGALAGAWWTGMVATGIPNSDLKQFEAQFGQGQVLMIVSAPFHRTHEIRERIAKEHPEAVYGGTWPTDHVVFP